MSEPRIMGLCPAHWAIMEKTGEEGMLLDTHIDKFIDILEHYNTPYRMQSTLLLQIPQTIRSVSQDEPCLQILFRGPIDHGHWICVWYDTEVLHVYDSANVGILHSDHRMYLCRLLPYDNIRVVFEKVQQQTNEYDCGVFSIAFAICVISGINPCSVQYDIPRMRPHLIDLFRSNCLINFPLKQANSHINESLSQGSTNIGHLRKCNHHLIATVEEGTRALESAKKKPRGSQGVMTKRSITKELNNNVHETTAAVSRQEAADRQGSPQPQQTAGQTSNRFRSVEIYARNQTEFIENAEDVRVATARKTAADRMKRTRADESEEQRVNRLKAAAAYIKKKRESIKNTDETRVAMTRKEAADGMQRMRAKETEGQRTDRLKTAATYKRNRRESMKEADDTRAAIILKEAADRKKLSRAKESEEQRINRLKAAATYKKEKKAYIKIDKSNKRKYSGEEPSSRTKKMRTKFEIDSRERVLVVNLDLVEDEIEPNYLGEFNHICQFCDARHFVSELPTDKKYNICCHKGKTRIIEHRTYPEAIRQLIRGLDVNSLNFMRNARSYNNALAFASFGAKLDSIKGRGPFVFRICGQTYHNTYSLHPDIDEARKYGQLYIIDNEIATRVRMQHPGNNDCLPEILSKLDDIIRVINPYAKAFKMMHEMEEEERQLANTSGGSVREVRMWLKRDDKVDKNRFNLPTCNEVAVVFVAEDGDPPVQRDVCVYSKIKGAISLPSLSKHVDPMTYPLIFPFGETGWTPKMRQTEGNREITALQYYSYKLSDRGVFNPCLNMGRLSQQYIVDMWTKVESNRLYYIKNQQSRLRAELYKGVIDYLPNKAGQDNARIGKMVILPSSFSGSPRALQQSFIDAMTLLQKYGKPDLFITITCNPKWKEIVENLEPRQTATDRPDLVARVFELKVKELKVELIDKAIFGKCVAYVYVIEFQKRGLPHAHMLFWLEEDNKIRNADDVDRIVSAEIPEKTRHPLLHEIVKQCMIHGPCGHQNVNSPCMDSKTNRCTKRYPKDYISETNYKSTGYPLYRRRDDGNVICDTIRGGVRRVADNRSVVPYNAYLLLKFNCHVNVEICTTVQCIKYLFKYCYKGHDCAVVEMKDAQEENSVNYDEVDEYISTRYVCPPEAMHRLYQFPMNEQSHAIYRLAVHVENEHTLYFEEGRENVAVDRNKESTLLAWLNLNKIDVEARNYLYCEIPTHYVFNKKNTEWTKRKKYVKPVLSRMYFVSPRETERYYLRLLLLHVRGAQSYGELRTFEGTTYSSFFEAAVARKLVSNDEEWDKCLAEGSNLKFPKEMCRLFAYICVFGMPINASELFEKYKHEMVDRNEYNERNEQKALQVINEILTFHGFTLQSFHLPDGRFHVNCDTPVPHSQRFR